MLVCCGAVSPGRLGEERRADERDILLRRKQTAPLSKLSFPSPPKLPEFQPETISLSFEKGTAENPGCVEGLCYPLGDSLSVPPSQASSVPGEPTRGFLCLLGNQ